MCLVPNRLPEDEPSASKHVEVIVKIKIHFVGVYYTIKISSLLIPGSCAVVPYDQTPRPLN